MLTFEDRGKYKAEAVRENALKLLPSLNIDARVFTIPVPKKMASSSCTYIRLYFFVGREDLKRFAELVEGHDVVLLLTDTRESRWLPTLLAAAYDKLAITVALGFDDFLITVHTREGGCYFCPDPLSIPGEINGGEKPLDLQCTVSRPGLSLLASGIASEMLVCILEGRNLGEPSLHVRGFLKPSLQISSYHTRACSTCPACGFGIVKAFDSNGGLPFLEDCLSNLSKVIKEIYPKTGGDEEEEVELETF